MKKRVLIIHNILWSHYRGIVFSELYKISNDKNIDMQCIHIAMNSQQRSKLGDVDFSIHNYPYKILFDDYIEKVDPLKKAYHCMREYLKFRPNVLILCGWDEVAYWILLLISKIINVKVIVESVTTEMDRPRKFIKDVLKKVFISLVDMGFPRGIKAAEYFKKLGLKKNNIIIVPNVNDISRFKVEMEKARIVTTGFEKLNNYFLYVGRLSPEKNVGTLIRAFGYVKDKIHESRGWKLILVGDGPQKQELDKLVKALGLEGEIIFEGGKKWFEVVRYYALSDVFVLPSISEPWGLVVNEAMVCGLPVVVSNRAGASFDLVKEGINGFTFDPFSVEDLVEKLSFFIKNPEKINEMGNESMKIISEYTPQNAAKQMLKGVEKVLADKKK